MAEESIPVPSSSSSTTPADAAALQAEAPHTFAGWASLQQVLNVTLPGELTKAEQLHDATLRVLGAR